MASTASSGDNVTGLVKKIIIIASAPVREYIEFSPDDEGEPANMDQTVCTSSPSMAKSVIGSSSKSLWKALTSYLLIILWTRCEVAPAYVPKDNKL